MRLMMMIIKISIISNIITLLKDGVINTGDWHCVDLIINIIITIILIIIIIIIIDIYPLTS